MTFDPAELANAFAIEGSFSGARPFGGGHIHETWLATFSTSGGPERVLLQAINTTVFLDPEGLMANIARITSHVRAALGAVPDAERRCLHILRTREGRMLEFDRTGTPWRAYAFIENTHSVEVVRSARLAREAARAFGNFADQLRDLDPDVLIETIPQFKDLDHRVHQLEDARRTDTAGRAAACGPELEDAGVLAERLARAIGSGLSFDALPRRITHNDCKVNNLLLDSRSDEPVCVVDLDTVMPGAVVCDFGGLVRTIVSRAEEDAPPETLRIDLPFFEALVDGYCAGAAFLEPDERESLAWAGAALAFEDGIRFLADHLNGDVYYRIHRDGHNLERARTQLALARLLLDERATLESAIRSRGR